jgi:hypothetical protein
MLETPTISASSYANALNLASFGLPTAAHDFAGWDAKQADKVVGRLFQHEPQQEARVADFSTRLVKVFIVDPNINLPLENRLLYRGDEKITDLTDQELFFEVDINGLLAKHNEIRLKTEDKKANKDKPVYLEAARVRDLKMQVVVLAQF